MRKSRKILVGRGSLKIPIYPSTNSDGYTEFRLCYRFEGKRKRESFSDLNRARRRALDVIAKFHDGDRDALLLTFEERSEYTRARELLKPLGISMDDALREFSQFRQSFPGLSLKEAGEFYLQRHPANLSKKSTRDICDEFIQSKKERCSKAYLIRLRQMLVGRVKAPKALRSDRYELAKNGVSKIQAMHLLGRSQELINGAVSKLKPIGRGQAGRFYDLRQIEPLFLQMRSRPKSIAQQAPLNLDPQRYEKCRNGASARTIAKMLGAWGGMISELISKNQIEPLLVRQGHDLYDLSEIEAALPPKALETPSRSFCSTFNCSLASISGLDLVRWIDSLPGGPTSKNDYRTLVLELWNFAKKRKYLPGDNFEPEFIEKRRELSKEIEIYTPEEVSELLSLTAGPLRGILALVAFGGLREAEACRLDWRDIGVAGGKYIEVKKSIAKTAVQRLIPMQENLNAWLEPCRKTSGPLWPFAEISFKSHYFRTMKKAGFHVKRNALRHSFISNRCAQIGAAQTAEEAGNSARTIRKHYLKPQTPEAAAKYFAVRPADANDKIAYLKAAG